MIAEGIRVCLRSWVERLPVPPCDLSALPWYWSCTGFLDGLDEGPFQWGQVSWLSLFWHLYPIETEKEVWLEYKDCYLQTNQKLMPPREDKVQVFDSLWVESFAHQVHAVYDCFPQVSALMGLKLGQWNI